jgi:ribose transport system substrate-binding protein
MNSLVRFWLCLLLLSLAGCAQKKEGETGIAPASQKSFTIAVIPKGTTHEFWKSINAGAVKAQRELADKGLKVDVIWRRLREDDGAKSRLSKISWPAA